MQIIHSTKGSRVEKELERLVHASQGDHVVLQTLLSVTHVQDQAMFTLIFSIPFLLPIPLPGLSIPFGLVIAWLALRMFLGRSFWMPAFLREKKLSGPLLRTLFTQAQGVAHRLSRWVKPRGRFFSKHPGNKRLSYFLICFCGLLLALPLPPGTNSPPALTIALLSLGVLEEDSLYLTLGYLSFSALILLIMALVGWGFPQMIQWFGY